MWISPEYTHFGALGQLQCVEVGLVGRKRVAGVHSACVFLSTTRVLARMAYVGASDSDLSRERTQLHIRLQSVGFCER